MRTRSKGFTLIELIVTLVIAGILVGLGVPALHGTLHAMRARGAAADLQTALATARLQAVSAHVAVTLCPSDDGTSCRTDGVWDKGWIAFHDPGRTGQPPSSSSVIRRWTLADVRVRSATARPLVRFLPHGAASGTNLTLTICAGSAVQQVVVNNAGRARRERKPAPTACS